MASSFLSVRLGLLLLLVVACAIGGAAALVFSKAYVAGTLLVAVAILQIGLMVHMLGVQQREVARFIDAVRFSDLSQTFSDKQLTKRLAHSLNGALTRLRDTISARDAETALLRALFEHAPVAVLAIGPAGSIDTMNEAARRLLGRGIGWVDDLSSVSAELAANLRAGEPSGRFLVRADLNDRTVRLVVASAPLRLRGREMRIVSIQNIESELGSAEFDAWRDLIRVLTHEVMNTLTPVTSLSQLIRSQASDVAAALEAHQGAEVAKSAATDLAESAAALNARAEALTRFIGAYRQLTRLPPPRMKEVQVSELLNGLLALQRSDGSGPALNVRVRPESLTVDADPDQLEQALLNLIVNAREASVSVGATTPVEIEASMDRSGAAAFVVSDSGSGVAEDLRERIFTPFFSTKPSGSGVGLSLVRQIALAHGGSVDHQSRTGGGSIFTLRLPASSQVESKNY